MLKKVGLVAATTIGLSLIATPAFATPSTDAGVPGPSNVQSWPTFGDAYNTFVNSGGALGYGAAGLVAGAYTGIATTPALIAHSFGG